MVCLVGWGRGELPVADHLPDTAVSQSSIAAYLGDAAGPVSVRLRPDLRISRAVIRPGPLAIGPAEQTESDVRAQTGARRTQSTGRCPVRSGVRCRLTVSRTGRGAAAVSSACLCSGGLSVPCAGLRLRSERSRRVAELRGGRLTVAAARLAAMAGRLMTVLTLALALLTRLPAADAVTTCPSDLSDQTLCEGGYKEGECPSGYLFKENVLGCSLCGACVKYRGEGPGQASMHQACQ